MEELELYAVTENIPMYTQFLDQTLEGLGCSMKVQMQLDIVIDEILSNVSRYAYPDKIGCVKLSIDRLEDRDMIELIFTDQGIPYNPLKKEDPDITKSAEEREIGGLGIYMVKKSMDEMEYVYRDEENILTIRKKL